MFDRSVPAACDIPDSPGTYTITCSAIDPIFNKKYEDSATVTVLADPECQPGGTWKLKCDPNVTGGTTGSHVDPNIGAGFQGEMPGSKPTSGSSQSGQPQPPSYTGDGKPEEEEPEKEEPQQWCKDKNGEWVPCDATEEQPGSTASQPGSGQPGADGLSCEDQCRIAGAVAGGLLGGVTMGAAGSGSDAAALQKCIDDCKKKGSSTPSPSSGSGGSGSPPPPKPPTTSTPSGGGGG